MRPSFNSSLLSILIGGWFLSGAAAAAQTHQRITLSDAIATALRQNPDLQIAAAAIDSSKAERRIAAAIPNPTLAGTPNTPYQYSVSMPLDFTPQRRYRTRVADFGMAAAELDRRDAARQITLAVARAFFDALLADERRAIAGQRRDAVAQILLADSARYRAGDVPWRDLTRSEVELARADADIARAALEVQASRVTLQGVMGIAHPDTSAQPDGSLAFRRVEVPSDSLVALALDARPDRQASERRIDQSRGAEGFARALLIPTPQFVAVRQFTAPFDNGHYYSFGLAFELPSFNRYDGQRDKARAGLIAAQIAERRASAQVERDVTTALADFRTQRDLAERFKGGVTEKMAQSVESARYAYAKGAASLLEVLDAVRAEQDVRTEYVTALHDYWISVYALNAAAGRNVLGVEP